MTKRPDSKRRRPTPNSRRDWTVRLAGLAFGLACTGAVVSALGSGCSGWDPTNPFERNSPEVDRAIEEINAGKYESAEEVLSKYLGTGMCSDGGIGLPDSVRDKYNGGFDLGLVLFHVAEKYGRRFGEEEEWDAGADDPVMQQRSLEVDCALIIVKAIAADPKVPAELRARARYLAGNLEFLRRRYEEAVKEYDEALTLVPGIAEDAGGDGIGRDAAWNRAIALRRIADQKDAGSDAQDEPDSPDEADAPDAPDSDDASDGNDGDADSGDSGDDANDGGGEPDSGKDGGADSGDGGPSDGGKDAGDGGADDKKQDQPQDPQDQPAEPDPKKQPVTPEGREDDRILDQLEEAPSYQEEEAKKRAAGRQRGRMEDK